ncbi:FGGY-family carbohydrate kinase [Mesorhizobium sp. SB112]|uniref:FGGY-family carbohydrate kinase n=1 Tax=Mesorhizobium sp. SB112 TaxID=3151853 RepID=UPI0032675CD5
MTEENSAPRHVAVIDIGKTNAKVALVDMATLTEIAVRTRPNSVIRDGIYPHADCDALWLFLLESLKALHGEKQIDAISITTHAATAVLLKEDGALAMPVLDYEHNGPDGLTAAYDAVRPPFAETGTPRLPGGLNLGAQLFWQSKAFAELFADVTSILMYPQYWSFRLTGVLASEVTSLGCHTDLWNPAKGDFSSLVDDLGWRGLFAPVRAASDKLGSILPEIVESTGLDPETPVYCGIHDSNASLLPHLLSRKAPFSVVSTGTWVIVMAMGGTLDRLDPSRDTLINVNALGNPVPSARFMGGREYSTLTGDRQVEWTEEDVKAVLQEQIMLLPSVQKGSGPFPDREAEWLNAQDISLAERYIAISFYLALMTATCLDLVGADGPIIVEGPFSKNKIFVSMLSAASERSVISGNKTATGTSIGAALLTKFEKTTVENPASAANEIHENFYNYKKVWFEKVRSKK